jgi:hypothetical protein
VLKVLPILQRNSFYQLAEGSTSIWSSPWCSAWQHVYDDLIIQQPGFQYPASPRDLWIPGEKAWDSNLVRSLFAQRTADSILATPILPVDEKDILCWKLTPNGKCSTKAAYKICLQVLQENGMPTPAPVSDTVKQLMTQVWKSKDMIPRIKTFIWRILRRALPSGNRASRFSRHIEKDCCRCGVPETDMHLFFLCPFAKAAWFDKPWFLRTEVITQNVHSVALVIKSLLWLNHPEANLTSIATFMWCIWKARNDELFCRKKHKPHQMIIQAKALISNLETQPAITHHQEQASRAQNERADQPKSGDSVSSDFYFAGPKLYVDAAWKLPRHRAETTAGLGIYLTFKEQNSHIDVLILAIKHGVTSPIQAEAHALTLAGRLAAGLHLREPTFFSDCANLVKAAAAQGASNPAMLWEIRRQAIEFQEDTKSLQPRIFHVRREINRVAHNCAHQAKRSMRSEPTRSCRNSAHSNSSCPVLAACLMLESQGVVIIYVQCL